MSKAPRLLVFILTRFSVLSNTQGHSWELLQSPWRRLARRRFGAKKRMPTLQEKRAYLFDPKRLQHRLHTFETFTLPSLANQVDRDFVHLVMTSEQLPPETRSALEALGKRFGFEIIDVDVETPFADRLAALEQYQNLAAEQVATMRIDDDDALGRNAVKTIKSLAGTPMDDFIVSWPKGLMLSARADGTYQFRQIDKPAMSCGLTRVRADNRLEPTVHAAGNHRFVGRAHKLLTMPDENAFLMTNHFDNISNREPRPTERLLDEETRETIRVEFGVNL